MASPVNQHCANCVGTLLFPMAHRFAPTPAVSPAGAHGIWSCFEQVHLPCASAM